MPIQPNFSKPFLDLLTPAEAARVIGISRGAMTYATRHGLIAWEQHGRYRLIPRQAAEAYRDRPFPPGIGRPRRSKNKAGKKTEEESLTISGTYETHENNLRAE